MPLGISDRNNNFGSMNTRQPSKNMKTIHSYFAHDPPLKQISVDSQAASLELSNKHDSWDNTYRAWELDVPQKMWLHRGRYHECIEHGR